jgi:hypothetical protein
MIVSYDHGFVFVKTRKTAGTSIELALSPVCGSSDIVTRLLPDEERARLHPAQNTRVPIRALDRGFINLGLRRRAWPHYYGHTSARRARRLMGSRLWSASFTFAVERNPFDRAVSIYYWDTRAQGVRPDFTDYICGTPKTPLSNLSLYSHSNTVLVDRILRYERLAEQLDEVREILGLPGPLELSRAKGDSRPSRSLDYRSMFTTRAYDAVSKACATEISMLEYEF